MLVKQFAVYRKNNNQSPPPTRPVFIARLETSCQQFIDSQYSDFPTENVGIEYNIVNVILDSETGIITPDT